MGGGVPARAAGPKAVGAPWIALCMLVTAPAWSEQEAGVQRATPPPAAPEREDERFNLDCLRNRSPPHWFATEP